jgi:hypothetical protein
VAILPYSGRFGLNNVGEKTHGFETATLPIPSGYTPIEPDNHAQASYRIRINMTCL